MSGIGDKPVAELTLADLRHIDHVCADFEDAWKSGQHPAVESYCSDVAEPERSALLRELLLLDLDYQSRRGELPSRADYTARFTDDHLVIDGVFSSVATSRVARGTVAPGQVFGDYELLEELGRGGMGVVFKARQTRLNRVVALKMILGGPYARAEQLERFHSEAEAAANLQHPNIVAVHEVGEHDGQPFLCMDYVDGASLRDLVREGPLPALRAAKYVQSIAKAMHYAHQQGTLHRDLKPANVLIDRADEPRITDFGLARQVEGCSELTGTGQVLGTPSYMPPEQALGRRGEVGPASDVYAMGATLYELLAGRPPFHGETATDTLLQVLHVEPVSPCLLNPRLPRDLKTICLKCLQKEPAKRYGSADALAQDLGRFLRSEPIQARPVGRLERTWRWCRRKPVVTSLAAAVVMLLLAGTGVSSYFAVQANARARDATHFATQAEARTQEATDRLWNAYLAQAQAGRRSGIPGQRSESLQALAAAAAIRPAKELRDEAITCMGLGDLQVQREWPCALVGDSAVQFSANLDCYASHDQRGAFWVRWVAGDREPFQVPGPYRRQEDFVFSPHAPWLAEKYVANNAAECRVWDVERREIVMRAPATTEIGGLEFSPDGQSVVIAGPDHALHFYRVADGTLQRSWGCDPLPTGIAFEPTGQRLAVSRRLDTEVRVMDVETGQVVSAASHLAGVLSVAWHPRGALLATSGNDSLVHVWNVPSGQLQTVLRGHQADVIATMFNPAGDLLATSSWDGTTRLWDPATGYQLLSTRGEIRRFSEDGERLAYWHYDVMGLWQLARPEYRTIREISPGLKGPWGASFHPDGRLLASASDDGVRLWDLIAGGEREIAFLPLSHTVSAEFLPTGSTLLTAGVAGLQQWPVTIDAAANTLEIGPFTTLVPPETLPCARVCLDEGGRCAAVAIRPDRVALLDLTRSDGPRVVQDRAGVEFIALSPDGRWMATGVFHGVNGVRIWDVPRAVPVQTLIPDCPRAKVLFSPDGKWLLTSTDQEYQFWEVGTWLPGRRIAREDKGLFGPMAFAPDGSVLALACSRYAVQLIEVATCRPLARLEPPAQQHLAWLCFRPDGTQLAATSESHTLQLWDLRAIRRRLATMNLDWPMPPYGPAPAAQPLSPLLVKVVMEERNQP